MICVRVGAEHAIQIVDRTRGAIYAVVEAIARFGKLEIFNSGLAIHQLQVHPLLIGAGIRISVGGEALPRQRLRRAHLEIGEIRGGLSARLHQRVRRARLDRPVSGLRQRPEADKSSQL